MDILTTTILSLNPSAEKSMFFNQVVTENVAENEEFFDLKRTFFFVNNYNSKIDYIKKHLESFTINSYYSDEIKPSIISNAFSFLDNLSPSIIEQINTQGIYSTSYGTIVFDIEKPNNEIFSLEIGKNEFGYFIEKEGVDVIQVDALKIDEMKKNLLTDLNTFLE